MGEGGQKVKKQKPKYIASFTILSKKVKYLSIKLVQDLYSENY